MILRTKLDWQGYNVALQNEETMGCSPQQTAMCVAISNFRDKTHETQEVLREMTRILRSLYPQAHSAILEVAEGVLADHTESVEGFANIPADADRPSLGK